MARALAASAAAWRCGACTVENVGDGGQVSLVLSSCAWVLLMILLSLLMSPYRSSPHTHTHTQNGSARSAARRAAMGAGAEVAAARVGRASPAGPGRAGLWI